MTQIHLPIIPILVLMSFGFGVLLMLMPTSVRLIFGTKEYASVWSIFAEVSCLGGFVGSPLYGSVFDRFHSYSPALFASFFLLSIGVILHFLAFHIRKKS